MHFSIKTARAGALLLLIVPAQAQQQPSVPQPFQLVPSQAPQGQQAQEVQKPQPREAQPARKPQQRPKQQQPQLSPSQIACLNRDMKATNEQQIAACSAIIKAGKDIPRNIATAFYFRGNVYAHMGQIDRAIEDYTQAIRRDPDHVAAFNNRGNAYGRKGNINRAIEDHSEAIRVAPKNPLSYLNRANDYQTKGQYDRALRDFTQAIKLNPKIVTALNGRCAARGILGRELKEAVADCDAALKLNPDDATRASIFDNRGLVYIRLGEFYTAVTDYNAALEINPRLATALYGRGYVKLKKGDFSGEADIASAKAIQPDIAENYAKFGVK